MNSSIQENNTKNNIYYGGRKVYQRPIIREQEEIMQSDLCSNKSTHVSLNVGESRPALIL